MCRPCVYDCKLILFHCFLSLIKMKKPEKERVEFSRHLVDEGRPSLLCLLPFHMFARFEIVHKNHVSFTASANYFYRFSFLRNLWAASWETCSKKVWARLAQVSRSMFYTRSCNFLPCGILSCVESNNDSFEEKKRATIMSEIYYARDCRFEGGLRDQVRGKGSPLWAPIFITMAYFV